MPGIDATTVCKGAPLAAEITPRAVIEPEAEFSESITTWHVTWLEFASDTLTPRLAQPPSVPGVRRRSGAARAKRSNGKGLKWQVQHRLPELAAPEAPAAFGALYARRRLELIFLRCAPSPLRT